MERGFTSLLALALLLLAPPAQASEPFRVFSMNLHCALGNWHARLDTVLDELARERPDVMGFQEVCRNKKVDMARYLVDGLESRGYHVAYWRTVDTHGTFFKYQEQLLVISGRPVHGVEEGKLPSMPFLRNKYLGVQLDGQWVVVTHLHFLLPQIRQFQAHKLVKLWSGRPVLLLGDFNTSGDAWELGRFAKRGWSSYFPGKTFPSDKPKKVFDGFLLSPELAARVESAAARRIFEGLADPPSDHLAVGLDLTLN